MFACCRGPDQTALHLGSRAFGKRDPLPFEPLLLVSGWPERAHLGRQEVLYVFDFAA
jgi:hypothetical protein